MAYERESEIAEDFMGVYKRGAKKRVSKQADVQKIYVIIDEGNDATFLSKHEMRSMFSM